MTTREAMMRTARMVVSQCAAVRPGEEVLVIGDTETISIAEVLAEAARDVAGEVVTAIMTPRAQHGNDPPATVAAAMQAADVILMAVTHSITHTTARKNASARGARAVILRSVTVESMTQGAATADYAELRRLTRALAEILTQGSTVHLTSDRGTDLRFSIAGRSALSLDGFATEPGTWPGFRPHLGRRGPGPYRGHPPGAQTPGWPPSRASRRAAPSPGGPRRGRRYRGKTDGGNGGGGAADPSGGHDGRHGASATCHGAAVERVVARGHPDRRHRDALSVRGVRGMVAGAGAQRAVGMVRAPTTRRVRTGRLSGTDSPPPWRR